MKLIVIGSSSKGNEYLLEDSSGEQLVIEAGCRIEEARQYGLKASKCSGVIVSHIHSDHSKHLRNFTKAGIRLLSTTEVKEMNKWGVIVGVSGQTYHFGSFAVTPIAVEHDVECFAYLVHHEEMGTLFFATDCYNLHQIIKGVDHFLIEANYSDVLLRMAVKCGHTSSVLADRIRLSHLSLEHCIDYLRMCEAEETAKTITLIHASERHLDKSQAIKSVAAALGVATYVAKKGLEVELI